MNQISKLPVAYHNGEFLPAEKVVLPVYDIGFIQGATISEQMRTFGHKLFQVDQHLERFWRGLELIKINCFSQTSIKTDLQELVKQNSALLDPEDDFGVSLFATPGPRTGFAPQAFFQSELTASEPTIVAHVYPLAFYKWADKYKSGFSLATSSYREVSAACWPKSIKCRSRMHYHLAELEASRRKPGSVPLLVDENGSVRDSSISSIVFYDSDRGFFTPGGKETLASISVEYLKELAIELQIPFHEKSISLKEAKAFDEVLLATTPWCIAPVASLDETSWNDLPGIAFGKLISKWSEKVDLSIEDQAIKFTTRLKSTR